MQDKVGMERGKQSNWCTRQLQQQRRMTGMAYDRMEGWAGAGQGGWHGKGAENVEGQVKWQNRANRRTQKKQREGHGPGRDGRHGLTAGQDRAGRGMVA